MDKRKFDTLENISGYYNLEENKQRTIKYLGEKNNIFWDCLNLAGYTQKVFEESDRLEYPKNAMSYLFFKFTNHAVTSYNLLIQNMQEEFLIMLRQSYEVLWLLKYFVETPHKEAQWIKKSFPQKVGEKIKGIRPYEVREAFLEDKEVMEYIYSNLSNTVHSNFIAFMNGISLGGFYDEMFIDLGISKIIISIHGMLELLYEILSSSQNKYLINDEEKFYIVNDDLIKSDLINEKLVNSIERYRECVTKLWDLQIIKDYEQEALEELISMGYLKVKE